LSLKGSIDGAMRTWGIGVDEDEVRVERDREEVLVRRRLEDLVVPGRHLDRVAVERVMEPLRDGVEGLVSSWRPRIQVEMAATAATASETMRRTVILMTSGRPDDQLGGVCRGGTYLSALGGASRQGPGGGANPSSNRRERKPGAAGRKGLP